MTNLRFAVRQLLRNPGFTATAVLILGLGIGANTAMFSLINALLFKPLAVERPREIVRLHSRDLNPEGGFRSFSYPNFADLRRENRVFRELTAFTLSMAGVGEGDTTRRVFAASVAANYFRTLDVRPGLGREFLPEEERPGSGAAVVIVSHGYWKRRGADPDLVGQTLQVNGRPFEVVGVAPEGFTGTSVLLAPELYVPLGVHEWMANDFTKQQGRLLSDRDNHCLMVAGRLQAGIRPEDAQAQLEPLAARLREAYPKENKDQTLVVARPSRLSINVAPKDDSEVAGIVLLLLPMSGVVLLVACLNLANMILARGTARQKEFAIRAALGGGRLQIIRQLVTEGLLLSAAGGGFALVLSSWVTNLLVPAFGSKLPSMTLVFDGRPDWRVLAVTFLLCVTATLLASLAPAMRLSRVDVMRDLKVQAGGQMRPVRRVCGVPMPRNVLVMGQVALAFVLLTVAGLFFRGALNAAKANPGFRFEQGVLVELDAGLAGYDEARSRRVYGAVLGRVRELPGVHSVSMASSIPFGLFSDGRQIARAGSSQAAKEKGAAAGENQAIYVNYVIIADDYFRSLGASMQRGREFDRLEVQAGTAAPVAILSEAAARKLWPGEEVVGRQIEVVDGGAGSTPRVLEVVGVAPGFKAAIGDQDAGPFLYVPMGQTFQSLMNLQVRLVQADVEAEKAMLGTVRAVLKGVDAGLPVLSVSTLRDFHNEGLMMWLFRTASRLFLAFALLALLLAVVGVYGVKAFVVARRTREIGIRMALGASRGQVLWMVLREGLGLTGSGLAVGLLLALGAGQLMRSMLFGVSGADPVSFGMALLVLALASMLASYLPARRAARVEPMVALRCD